MLLLLALVSLLPHLPALMGMTYYFRDFTLTFYPLRLFQAREIAAGRWPFWNPYVNEGTFALPAFYPIDLLHAFWPGPAAVSRLLALHFPLAAAACYALARQLGAGRFGAFVAGCGYALGGLAVSSLNLYVFLQALALAPLTVVGLRRAASSGGRAIVVAALVVAAALSTLALEFVAQGLLLGAVLAVIGPRAGLAARRVAASVFLGLGLAAVPVAIVAGVFSETVRGGGFAPSVAFSYQVHPVGLLQALVPGLFGSLGAPLEHWWGGRFFTTGFPYFATIYVGPLLVGLALVGTGSLEPRRRNVLLAMAGLGLWYSLGSWGGLAPLLSHWPLLRSFRFPSKALLLPFLVLVILAGLGADRLRLGSGWRPFLLACLAQGGLVAALGSVVLTARPALGSWLALSPSVSAEMGRAVPLACLGSAALALAAALLGWFALRGRLPAGQAALLIAALAVADLVREAAVVNPVTSEAFFKPLPQISALRLDALGGSRVFSYGVQYSPRFKAFLSARRPGTGLWAFFVNRQLLAPFNNVIDHVETAEGLDRTAFLPHSPALAIQDYDPRAVSEILPRLRNAAVSRVVSVDPLEHPDLRLLAEVAGGPPGIEIFVYELRDSWPRAYVGCRLRTPGSARQATADVLSDDFDPRRDVSLDEPGRAECSQGDASLAFSYPGEETYDSSSDGNGYLVARASYARGWSATVDGQAARVLRANGVQRAVAVGAGRHRVVFRYEPPGLRAGVAIMLAAALAAAAVWLAPVLRRHSPPASGPR